MSLQLSFLPGEYIAPGTPVSLHSHCELHSDCGSHAVRLLQGGEELKDRIAVRGNSLEVSTEGLIPGTYTVAADGLLDIKGKSVEVHPVTAHFKIRKLCGDVPEDFHALHVVHLAVGELSSVRLSPGEQAPDGATHIDMVKGIEKGSHEVRTLAFDVDGNEVDGDQILQELWQRRAKKFGKLDEPLWHKMQGTSDNSLLDVVIWPLFKIAHPYNNTTEDEESDLLPHMRAFQAPKAVVEAALEDLGAEFESYVGLPVVITRLRPPQIRRIAALGEVAKIFPRGARRPVPTGPRSGPQDVTPVQEQADKARPAAPGDPNSLEEMLDVTRCKAAHLLGFQGMLDGIGVKVAVWEDGWNETQGLGFVKYCNENPGNPPASIKFPEVRKHYRYTSAIIMNKHPQSHPGFAPFCQLYFANDTGLKGIDWAVNEKKCTVINQSFFDPMWELPLVGPPGDLHWWHAMKDYLAMQPPFPVFVQSSGNKKNLTDIDSFVVHRGFNGLVVGNHNRDATAMHWSSYYVNPDNAMSNQHDRELPDICGPGSNVRILEMANLTGTSFSAPAVAGVVALIQGAHLLLQSSPHACRAIIYACAGRRIGHGNSTWYDDISKSRDTRPDLRDGAGAVDAEAAVKIARHYIAKPNAKNPITTAGWSIGLLTRSSFNKNPDTTDFHGIKVTRSKFSFLVKTPAVDPAIPTVPLVLRVALAWNSTTKIEVADDPQDNNYSSFLVAHYDLLVVNKKTGKPAAWSLSFDNNYEIAQINNAPPKTEFEIFISEQKSSVPVQGVFSYAIAWQMFRNTFSID